jgi:O-antigen ligase
VSVFQYMGLLCAIGAIVRIVSKGRVPAYFGIWPLRLVYLLYALAFIAAVRRPSSVPVLDESLTTYTSGLLIILITLTLVDNLERLRWTILALIGSYAWACLYVIREWMGSSGLRPGWIVGDSNFFATSAIFSMVLAFYFMRSEGPRWQKLYCLGCLTIMLVGTTLCASRGGFLGLCVAAPILAWETKNRVRNFAVFAGLLLAFSLFLPISPLQRILHPTYSETGSEEAHQAAWKAGFRMIQAHPLGGIGTGLFKPYMPAYSDPGEKVVSLAHNMFIEVAAEMGIPALIVFILFLASCYFGLGRIRKLPTTPAIVKGAAGAMRAGVLGFSVAGCFVSEEYQKTMWMGLAIVPCLMLLSASKTREAERPEYDTEPADANVQPASISAKMQSS